ncbi:MAG: hypothetical protein R2733_11630 [Acidimicrobiales bacterium]
MSSTDSHFPTRSSGSIPAWAGAFRDPATARHFVSVVADVIEQRWGDTASFDLDDGRLTLADRRTIDFANTAHELVGFDEPYWRQYLFLMLSDYEAFDPQALDRELRSWTQIRSRLRVRLFPTTTPEVMGDRELIRRPVSDHLSFIIAADSDLGCVPVPADVTDEWGKPLEQAWRAAIKNTRVRASFHVAVANTPTANFIMLDGDLYTTGAARDLDRFLPGVIGPHGALVAAPTSRSLFVQPIEHPDHVADDAMGLAVAAATFMQIEPSPLSNDVLWYRGVDELVGALDIGPGHRIRNVAPEPMASWLGPD